MVAPADTLTAFTRRLARRVFADEPLFKRDRLVVWTPGAETQDDSSADDSPAQEMAREKRRAAAAHDFLLADADARGAWPTPDDVFPKLVWGGQMLLVSQDASRLAEVAHRYDRHDCFDLEVPVTPARRWPGRWVRLGRSRLCYAVIRRVTLLAPGEHTDRSTFDVRLVRMPSLAPGYVVRKQVPTHRRVAGRLQERFPDAPHDVLIERAAKLVGKVFPVFLTREAGFLQLLMRDLPPDYQHRVPRALGLEKASDGTVKRLYMSWLRMDDDPIDQLDFALQASQLLGVVHETAKVIHLDLRLDNMVLSGGEVCFIDFGSSVRVGENIRRNPMLYSLFEEMMNTSQIQRTMGRMKDKGRLTSDVILSAHGKMDRAVDMFYLSLQITHPVTNPELANLIRYEKTSEVARQIKALVAEILRPPNPEQPKFISAADVHRGLEGLAARLTST